MIGIYVLVVFSDGNHGEALFGVVEGWSGLS